MYLCWRAFTLRYNWAWSAFLYLPLKDSIIGTMPHEFSLQQGNASRDAKFIGGERRAKNAYPLSSMHFSNSPIQMRRRSMRSRSSCCGGVKSGWTVAACGRQAGCRDAPPATAVLHPLPRCSAGCLAVVLRPLARSPLGCIWLLEIVIRNKEGIPVYGSETSFYLSKMHSILGVSLNIRPQCGAAKLKPLWIQLWQVGIGKK
jgi:hypothetical protein